MGQCKPLYYTNFWSDDVERIKAWISGKRDQILVVSYDLIRGFEHEYIIDTGMSNEMASRSSAYLVEMGAYLILSVINIHEKLRIIPHQCATIMDWNSRPQFNLNISSMIGNLFSESIS